MANQIVAGNSSNGGTAISTDTSGTLNIVTGSGSGATAVTVDGSGNVVVTGTLSASGGITAGIGTGQTWQNVTSSRAIGTTYTNSTGKPIMISVSATGNGGFIQAILIGQINGVAIITNGANSGTAGGATYASFSLIIPSGATYGAANGGGCTLQTWFELR